MSLNSNDGSLEGVPDVFLVHLKTRMTNDAAATSLKSTEGRILLPGILPCPKYSCDPSLVIAVRLYLVSSLVLYNEKHCSTHMESLTSIFACE